MGLDVGANIITQTDGDLQKFAESEYVVHTPDRARGRNAIGCNVCPDAPQHNERSQQGRGSSTAEEEKLMAKIYRDKG